MTPSRPSRWWPVVLGTAMLVAMGAVAHAADAPAPVPASAPAVQAVGQLRVIFQQITAALDAFAAGNAALVTIGKRTAVTLFGVLLVWGMIRSWILGKGFAQLLPEFIQPLVIFGLTFWAVDHLGPAVKGSVEALGGVFSQTLHRPAGPLGEVDIIDRMAAAGFDIVSASAQNSATDWVSAVSMAVQGAVGLMFRLVAAVLLLVAGAVAAGVMLMAKVQTALAILFAPVMIPWAMWQPSTFLFNAWLGFLISGAMQGVMAAAIASLSLTIIDALVLIAKPMSGAEGVSYITCCVILLMSVLIGFMFVKVPALSAALVGSAAIGMDRWSAVAQSSGKGLGQLGKPAGAVGAVGAGAYRFGHGAAQRLAGAKPAPAPGASSVPPSPALAAAPVAGTGKGVGAASPMATAGQGSGAAPAFPTAPASAAPAHTPFRPKTVRPVNRPIHRDGSAW